MHTAAWRDLAVVFYSKNLKNVIIDVRLFMSL